MSALPHPCRLVSVSVPLTLGLHGPSALSRSRRFGNQRVRVSSPDGVLTRIRVFVDLRPGRRGLHAQAASVAREARPEAVNPVCPAESLRRSCTPFVFNVVLLGESTTAT